MTDPERREVRAEAFREAAKLAMTLGEDYVAGCILALADKQHGLIVVPGFGPPNETASRDVDAELAPPSPDSQQSLTARTPHWAQEWLDRSAAPFLC